MWMSHAHKVAWVSQGSLTIPESRRHSTRSALRQRKSLAEVDYSRWALADYSTSDFRIDALIVNSSG